MPLASGGGPQSRRGLLVVSYQFPPAGVGVQRVAGWMRGLDYSRYRAVVLTVKPSAGQGIDESLAREMAALGVEVHRTGSLDPYRLVAIVRGLRGESDRPGALPGQTAREGQEGLKALLAWMRRNVFLPDDRMGWIPFALARGLLLVRSRRIGALYSTGYPYSAHVVAGLLASLTRLPWVADFRDGWTQHPALYQPGSATHAALQRGLERWVARRATRVLAATAPVAEHLSQWRAASSPRAEALASGVESRALALEPPKPLVPGRRTLLYTGSFIGHRRPTLFLDALLEALHQDPTLAERWRVRLRTWRDARAMAEVSARPLGNLVEFAPPVSRAEAMLEQQQADALLLLCEHGPGTPAIVPHKLYEYLGARRPIFAVLPEGAAADLLATTGGATVSHSLTPRVVAVRLREFLESIDDGLRTVPDPQAVSALSLESMSARFNRLLDSLEWRESR